MPIVDPFEKGKGIVDPFDKIVKPPESPQTIFSLGEYTNIEATPEESKRFLKGGVRIGMETGGQLLGGLGGAAVGTAVAPGAGTLMGGISGETVGYAAGSKGADLLFGEDTGSWGRKLSEGAAFSVVPRVLSSGVKALGEGAVRSALKIPPTQTSEESARSAVDTIIKENLRIGEGGVTKGTGIIKGMEEQIDSVLKKSGSSVNVSDIADVIESQKPRFAYSSDPKSMESALDSIKEKALNHPSVVDGKLSLSEAQKLKKGLYRELHGFYKNLSSLEPNKQMAWNASSVGTASWAEGLRKSIMSDPTVPSEATTWLKREANVINAMRWIERRANVAANLDPITFNDVLLGGLIREGVPAAVGIRILRAPAVQSQIGIWMAKGAPALGQPLRAGAIASKNLLSAGNQ